MFAPDGWITLRDVYHYFVWYFSENDRIGPYEFTGDECYELSWLFAERAESLSVCTSTGTVVQASRQLVTIINECTHENEHLNLHYGTVGSGEVLQVDTFPDDLTRQQYMAVTYGPFQYLPIIFLESEFDKFLSDLIEEDGQFGEEVTQELPDGPRADMSPRAVSERILLEWEREKSLTFSILKELVAPSLSVRAFRFAWGLAVMKEPKLSKAGRRKKS